MRSVSGYCGTTLKVEKFLLLSVIPKGKKKDFGAGKIFEVRMDENVPNLMKDINLQIIESQ